MDTLNGDARLVALPPGAALLDCDVLGTRAVNQALRALEPGTGATVAAPRGRHNLAVGLDRPVAVMVEGNAGYFLGGLCGEIGRAHV